MLRSRSSMGLGSHGPGPWGPGFRWGAPLWYPQPSQVEIIVKSDETEVKDRRPGQLPSKEIEEAKEAYKMGKGNPFSGLGESGGGTTVTVLGALVLIAVFPFIFASAFAKDK